jgi:F-type H+-transporting ATPase subunit delta
MKISKQARREAKSLFQVSQVTGVLDESRVRQAVDALLAQKPRGYVAILSQLERLVKLDIARRTARIESVVPLEANIEGSLKAALTKRYGPGLQFSFGTNASLIGGMRVQVGSDVYDGSIQARLEALRNNFQAV